ncbi:serine/threonine-protein kinase EDR1-like isoform X1 [Lolium rigidum]|uniref:serine/threonine-protein kinase EDR1-like isoform X1 n=1 Tax=Lolium rigidum TaxID=89674 RepID=UPI001F5CFB6B|nr:serine/threonine-protein kinase EDR1-like isoform X1 [Lolium rigidum]
MKIPFVTKWSHRSNEPAGPSNSAVASGQQQEQQLPPLPSPSGSSAPAAAPSPSLPVATTEAAGDEFILQEEEYQMQLALALSASASGGDGAGDPDGEQIRKAKLMSLGRGAPVDTGDPGDGDTAESLSRRYRDYNFLDYNEKVIDGFYDIFGISVESSGLGKIPSLAELQSSIGDLGYEVIVVDHKFDTALQEMKEVAECCLLGCPEITVLVRRIAEVVADHMGGPVIDANEMITRWLSKSIEQRTSHQTSLLHIGSIEIGLSRHRALLFKILADSVGIPCKLVKGSHYTGLEDDAINIIKMDNRREFLVDVMAAPGTLIPADVFNSRGTSFNSSQVLGQSQVAKSASNIKNDPVALQSEHKHNQGHMFANSNRISDNQSGCENTVTAGSSASESGTLAPQTRLGQTLTFTGAPSKQKNNLQLIPESDETEESQKLFVEFDPFNATESGRSSLAFKGLNNNRNNEFQRRRENGVPAASGRSQQPLVMKNWSACNDISNNKQYNIADGSVSRRNASDNVASSSQLALSTSKHYNSNARELNDRVVYAAPARNYGNRIVGSSAMPRASTKEHIDRSYAPPALYYGKMLGTSSANAASTSGIGKVEEKEPCDDLGKYPIYSAFDGQLSSSAQGSVPKGGEHKENCGSHGHKRFHPDPRKPLLDRFMDTRKQNAECVSPSHVGSSTVDMVLDEVSECEILWEDLVIDERIGIGSYGEVYHADWNGTEVAVKKFLDQEFYGDALDEFRCEVRIMRRLRHPNIVLFMGAVTRPPHLSIVSEYLPRGSLYQIIHRPNCQIDEKRRIKMALDVARGMNCLHTSVPTIVHRDLKSPNLLVDDNWTVKVCDFGLSRLKHSTFLSSKSTAGTPEWMAPEVLRNEQSNEKCDIYSFGVILWELATLRNPWHGMNQMQVVGAVGFQDRRLDIPKEVDPIVASIIRDCWQKDPNLRPSFIQLTSYLKTLQRLVTPSHQETGSNHVPYEISLYR